MSKLGERQWSESMRGRPELSNWDDSLSICVVLRHPGTESSESSYSFVRFKIGDKIMEELLDSIKSDASKGIIRYVRHQHDVDTDYGPFFEYSIHSILNGPFPSKLKGHCGTCAIGSVVYCIGQGDDADCHVIHYCDFGESVPQWKLTKPLPCHRFYPTLVSVNDQLCVIEDPGFWMNKDYYSKRSSFGLLFDPVTERFREIPFSGFHKFGASDLKVSSTGRNLLVMDRRSDKQFYFDIDNSTWIPLHDVYDLGYHISNILMNPVPVVEQNTLYWIDKHAEIGAYNWDNFRIFVGPVVGFSHECNLMQLKYDFMTLLHLKDELFCLIWTDFSPKLHLTVIHICLDNTSDTLSNSPHRLTASVLACYCYPLASILKIQAAHLLGRGSKK